MENQNINNDCKTAAEFDNGLVRYSDKEIKKFSYNKILHVAQSEQQVREFIETARDDKNFKGKLLLGRIGGELSAKIKQEIDIDFNGYSLELVADDVRHTFRHHGNEKTEMARGQRAITVEDIANFHRIVTEFDNVNVGYDADGKEGVIFTKNINGKITAVTVHAGSIKTLSLKTMYADGK